MQNRDRMFLSRFFIFFNFVEEILPSVPYDKYKRKGGGSAAWYHGQLNVFPSWWSSTSA